ncbi:PHB depolymerase family esterase [Allomuricauda sp. d1]|uniref:alpha/beta hydrolase family esterase n=1 Tax=Allomuricauda sp. d1 TaxID=3136725 RepID=UPI0031DD104C
MKTSRNLLVCSFLIVSAAVLFFGCGSSDDDPNTQQTDYEAGLQFFEMTWENRIRTYQVYFPEERFSENALPLLFVLHGGGGDATGLIEGTFGRFNELADIHGFIVVYPEGFEKQWNDGRGANGLGTTWDENIDDVGFISEIVRRLQSDFTIDENYIFTSGISNGGFMSSRLLCDRSDIFKGGAIITATLPDNYLSSCNPTNPTSVIVMNGTEDPLVPYEGGQITILGQERGLIVSTDAYMQFWANANGCESTPMVTDLPDTEDDGTTVQVYEYPSCNGQASVQLYRIEGGGHTWPSGQELLSEVLVGRTSKEFVACDVIWDFFNGL